MDGLIIVGGILIVAMIMVAALRQPAEQEPREGGTPAALTRVSMDPQRQYRTGVACAKFIDFVGGLLLLTSVSIFIVTIFALKQPDFQTRQEWALALVTFRWLIFPTSVGAFLVGLVFRLWGQSALRHFDAANEARHSRILTERLLALAESEAGRTRFPPPSE